MAQGVLPFKYETGKKAAGMTAPGGLPAYPDVAHTTGLRKSIHTHLKVRAGGKGLPPYQPCSAAKGYFFVGRHPHADRRGLQPASADALSGGKRFPLKETFASPPFGPISASGSKLMDSSKVAHNQIAINNFNGLQQKNAKIGLFAKLSKWYPRNIQYIPPVPFFAFLEREQKQISCKGLIYNRQP